MNECPNRKVCLEHKTLTVVDFIEDKEPNYCEEGYSGPLC